MNVDNHSCRLSIPRTENTVHYVQFRRPLTAERRFFFVELENISKLVLDLVQHRSELVFSLSLADQCQVIIGIASSKHALNEAPGLTDDTVGYSSFTGKLLSNRKDVGNMRGHRCKRGDTMGVEIEVFDKEMSVALFSKNFRPIGTRYLTLRDHSQYLPTILIENGGEPVELLVYWQTRVSVPPHYSVVRHFSVRAFSSDFLLFSSRETPRIGVCLKERKLIWKKKYSFSQCIWIIRCAFKHPTVYTKVSQADEWNSFHVLVMNTNWGWARCSARSF